MTPDDDSAIRAILDFWFVELGEDRWFAPDAAIDRAIAARFGGLYERARNGAFDHWADHAAGALALTIMLDQFPRNMFRGTARAFESDPHARRISRMARENAFDQQRPARERAFFYLPLMHSEDVVDQTECVLLYRRLKDENGLDFALQHQDIIARFGRFPHRNAIVGRPSTEEEAEFLRTHKGF
jgi:uncharacterized protein (DUF924 family)